MTAALDTAVRTAHNRATRRGHYARRVVVDGRPVAPLPAERHGRLHTYQHYGCRCVVCSDVAADYREDRRPTIVTSSSRPEVALCLPLTEVGTVVVAPQHMCRAGTGYWRCKLCDTTGTEPTRDDAWLALYTHARSDHQAAQSTQDD